MSIGTGASMKPAARSRSVRATAQLCCTADCLTTALLSVADNGMHRHVACSCAQGSGTLLSSNSMRVTIM